MEMLHCVALEQNEQNTMNKTKKLFSKQNEAIKIIHMTDILANLNSDEKIKHLDILNMYKQILNTKHNTKHVSSKN